MYNITRTLLALSIQQKNSYLNAKKAHTELAHMNLTCTVLYFSTHGTDFLYTHKTTSTPDWHPPPHPYTCLSIWEKTMDRICYDSPSTVLLELTSSVLCFILAEVILSRLIFFVLRP